MGAEQSKAVYEPVFWMAECPVGCWGVDGGDRIGLSDRDNGIPRGAMEESLHQRV